MWKRLIRSSNSRSFLAGHVFAGVALTALGGALVGASNSENLLRSSFDQAIRNQAIRNSAEAPVTQEARIPAAVSPVSGSEEFWLTALAHDGGQPVSKSVTIGDRISMSLGGVEKSLEVASVSEFDPKITEIDTRTRSVRLVLVTARDTADSRARPIRFVMELETAPEQGVAAAPAKTL